MVQIDLDSGTAPMVVLKLFKGKTLSNQPSSTVTICPRHMHYACALQMTMTGK